MTVVAIILAFALSAFVTFLLIPQLIKISYRRRLFDKVDERKVHKVMVSRLGGIAFAPSIILGVAMALGFSLLASERELLDFFREDAMQLLLFISGMLLIYFGGVTDDILDSGYKLKFLVQFLGAACLAFAGIYLNNFYGLFGFTDIPAWFGVPLSVTATVFIINAMNLIDGIDGLAAGLSIIACFFFGCLFYNIGELLNAVLAFSTLGAVLTFFFFNVYGNVERRRKIFMGDCGSQTLGLILAYFAISFSMAKPESLETLAAFSGPQDDIVSLEEVLLTTPLVVAFSIIMIPVLDTFRVFGNRILAHKDPFLPDRTHIHHRFIDLGLSHRATLVVILMLAAFFVLLNLLLIEVVDINVLFCIDIFLWTAMHVWISALIKRRVRRRKS